MRQILLLGTAVIAVSLFGAGTARADLRQYLVTYGYQTPGQRELEIEQWTESFHDRGGGTVYRSRTEIEYGVTGRLAASLYLVNKRPVGGSWRYDETKLEFRYRLTEPRKRFWDTAAYLEVARPNDSEEPYEMEGKAILSHDFPRFNLTLNLNAEKELEPGGTTKEGYAIGLSPRAGGRFKYSAELFGEEREHYVMPALWIRPGGRQNIGLGVAVGLTGASDRLQIRTLYAREF